VVGRGGTPLFLACASSLWSFSFLEESFGTVIPSLALPSPSIGTFLRAMALLNYSLETTFRSWAHRLCVGFSCG